MNLKKNIAKLKAKFSNVRTGGKGTVRRKVKKKFKIKKTRISQEEKEFNKIIGKINKTTEKLENDKKQVCWVYIEEALFDVFSDLRKKDFNRKSKWNIKNMMEHQENFIHDNFFINNKIIPNYEIVKKTFSNKGFEYIINSYYVLFEEIEKEEYIDKCEDVIELDRIKEYLELLNLPVNEIPSKKVLKKAYLRKSLEVHPDKNIDETEKFEEIFKNVQKAYKSLLLYYYQNK